MLINISTFLVILILTFVNGLTDATNAISTVVGTKVMSFRKACMLSAFFDMLGIFTMYYINSSIVDCISGIVNLPYGTLGLIPLIVGMISAIIFSWIAMLFGIPTSESHGLISGITGAGIAIGGLKVVKTNEWIKVILGLMWSLIGTIVMSKAVSICIKKFIYKIEIRKIKKLQILSCMRNVFCTRSTRWS